MLIVALLTLVALLSISAITVINVRTGSRVHAVGRMQRVAAYASQAGVAAGLDYLRTRCEASNHFTDILDDTLTAGVDTTAPDVDNAGYRVRFRNNAWDPSGDTGVDQDDIVHIVAEGWAEDDDGNRLGQTSVLVGTYQHPSCGTAEAEENYGVEGGLFNTSRIAGEIAIGTVEETTN